MAAFASFGAYFSRRVIRVFPVLSLDAHGHKWDSLFTWFSNEIAYLRGRTGHMINKRVVLLKSQSLDLGIRTVIIFKK